MAIECGSYKHFKGKNYTVYGVAHSFKNKNEMFVLYEQNYGNKGFWLRPESMFTEMVTDEGQTVKRFDLLDKIPSDESIRTLSDMLKNRSITFTHTETAQKYKLFYLDTKKQDIVVMPCESESASAYLTDTQMALRMGYDLYRIDEEVYMHPTSFSVPESKRLVICKENHNGDPDTEYGTEEIRSKLNACSIDLHISDRFFSKAKRKTIDIASMMHFSVKASELWKEIYLKRINGFDAISVHPGQTIITHTSEKITIPSDCAGKIEIKSTYARLALTVTESDFCNPGWKGYFPLAITNNSKHTIILHPKEKMLQLSLVQTDGYIINEYPQKATYMNDDGTPFKFWHAQTIKHLQKERYSDEILKFYNNVLAFINSDNSENADETKSRFEDTFLLFCEKKLKSEKYNTAQNTKQLLKKIWREYRQTESTKKKLLGKFSRILAAIITFIPAIAVACIDMLVNGQLSWSLLLWFLGSLSVTVVLQAFLHILTPKCFCTLDRLEFDKVYNTENP